MMTDKRGSEYNYSLNLKGTSPSVTTQSMELFQEKNERGRAL